VINNYFNIYQLAVGQIDLLDNKMYMLRFMFGMGNGGRDRARVVVDQGGDGWTRSWKQQVCDFDN